MHRWSGHVQKAGTLPYLFNSLVAGPIEPRGGHQTPERRKVDVGQTGTLMAKTQGGLSGGCAGDADGAEQRRATAGACNGVGERWANLACIGARADATSGTYSPDRRSSSCTSSFPPRSTSNRATPLLGRRSTSLAPGRGELASHLSCRQRQDRLRWPRHPLLLEGRHLSCSMRWTWPSSLTSVRQQLLPWIVG
jgi:hypothetical protein